jgi:cell wall-associated NlpC family hydrolase
MSVSGSRGRPALAALRHANLFIKSVAVTVSVAFIGLTLQPLAMAAQLPERKAPVVKVPTNEERLANHLEAIERYLEKHEARAEARIRTRKLASVASAEIAQEQNERKVLRQELDTLDRQALDDFDKIERHLKDKRLPSTILQRHAEAVKTYRTEMGALKANVDDVETAATDAERKAKVQKARDHLKAKQKKRPHTPVDPKNLPTRVLTPNKDNKPKLRKEEFVRAGLFDSPTVKLAALGDFTFDKLPSASDPAYLTATPEVGLSDAIKARAQALSYDPVKIYQFVHNNVEWIPSWGSIQGAELTLRSRKGNSLDTASLLIALLRASGIPSRYVHGTIDVPADRFTNWAGGFTDVRSAADFASSGGVPSAVVITGGKISSVRIEHIWVEAAIDFHPSRGAINKAADSWVSLDPSFKQHDITAGTDLTALVPFSADVYLSQLRTENPVQYYQQQIQSYLDANLPDRTLGQIMGFRVVRQESSTALPSALPFKTIVVANRYGSLPAALRGSVQLELTDVTGVSVDTATFSTPEVGGKRLTLSYAPASSADEALIASHGGDMYAVPPYLLYLVPVVRADGQVIYTGQALSMGQEQRLRVVYQTPAVNVSSVPQKLVAGGYYALGLNLQGVNEGVLGNSNARMIDTLVTQTAPTAQVDDTLGQHLYSLAMTYYLMNDKLYRGAAKLYQVEAQRTLSAGLVGISPTVSYFFGIPRAATPNRLSADIGLEAIQATSREGNATKLRSFLELRGLAGSFSEGAVFEAIHGFDSVSAVKALQAAAAQGVPVYKIDQSNAAQILPLLQLASEDRQEIQDGIAVGLVAIVPQRDIVINEWSGAGFIIKDPQTASGVYRISGGLSGSTIVKFLDGLQIVSLFKGPFAWLFDKIDPMTRGAIITAAELMTQEVIIDTANFYAKPEVGYEDVFQCSGLVRIAYRAAGICLDEYKGSGGCSDNLAARYGIAGPNGVYIHYHLANTLRQNNSVRTTNDPLAGDIVFFEDTSGPNHPLNHEGIIVGPADNEGTWGFIHAAGDGVHRSNINIIRSTNPMPFNSRIGDPQRCGQRCLAGQLFKGFGTIRDPKTLSR